MDKRKYITVFVLVCLLLLQNVGMAAAADLTTKYRVYQYDRLMMEFSDYNKAVNYAKTMSNSHVEQIGTRKWLWDNFPRYKVYQYDHSSPAWEYRTLDAAVAEAKKWANASVKDLHTGGWVWNNYPKYKVYQGENTLPSWNFADLNSAVKEAKKWANAHIIDLRTNRWVWDNVPEAKKRELRSGPAVYQVYQGTYTSEKWKFAYLEDAVNEALKWADSVVVNTARNQRIVFSNIRDYGVYQDDKLLKKFVHIDAAIAYAKQWAHAKITFGQREIWNNYPYYRVYQGDKLIGEYNTIQAALGFAMKYANASIATYHGVKVWDNFTRLLFWGWNGMSDPVAIQSQVSQTAGLDIDSPTWFELTNADGSLKDSSNAETVQWLKKQGIAVHPLVNNQFKGDMTSQFLSSAKAQDKFIGSLVSRCAELGVDGINLDFESLAGSDRNAYTAFVKKLAARAHAEGLKVSIDLPRGSVKWNHLTAYDHAQLAQIVDYVIIMAYDQHYSGSPSPGSVAGLQWAEEGVKEFLSYGIPRDKLILGIPFYVREWKLDGTGKMIGNRALYMKDIPALLSDIQAVKTWDESFNQYRVEYEQDGFRHVFWLEDESTVKQRMEIARKYELAGVAAWRLGYEPAALWETAIKAK